MTNYSNNPAIVRCTTFKLRVEAIEFRGHMGGKWYNEFELDMSQYYDLAPQDGVKRSLMDKYRGKIPEGFSYVVLEPYSIAPIPVIIHVWHTDPKIIAEAKGQIYGSRTS